MAPVRIHLRRRTRKPSRFSRILRGFLLAGGLLATFTVFAIGAYWIASSTAQPPVPDLRSLDLETARTLVASVGLRLAEGEARFDDVVPEGRIATQEPAPGSRFRRGRAVRVSRSLGPTRRPVPRLENQTLTEARRQLEASGLTVGRVAEVTSDLYLPGRVVAQSPVAHADAMPGTPVSVLLSIGAETEAFLMPDFIGMRYGDIADDLSRAAIRVRDVTEMTYRGVPAGIVVDQMPVAGARVTWEDRVSLTLSR